MAGLTPLPPTLLHSSQRLTHAQAYAQLAQFLDLAENDAAYRPDSTLTERGPQSASTGANPDLTLHHLKRILQGINGKRIGGADVGRFFGDGAVAAGVARLPRAEKRKQEDASQEVNGDNTRAKRKQVENQHTEDEINGYGVATREQDNWQDKGDYELAQREGGMELLDDDRQPRLTLPQPQNAKEAEELVGVEIEATGEKINPKANTKLRGKAVDKDARRAAKKARRKEEQQEKHAAIRKKK